MIYPYVNVQTFFLFNQDITPTTNIRYDIMYLYNLLLSPDQPLSYTTTIAGTPTWNLPTRLSFFNSSLPVSLNFSLNTPRFATKFYNAILVSYKVSLLVLIIHSCQTNQHLSPSYLIISMKMFSTFIFKVH